MALEVANGVVTCLANTTGNYSVTGLSFQPKVVIIWGSSSTSIVSGSARGTLIFGAATSSSARFCMGATIGDNENYARTHHWNYASKFIYQVGLDSTPEVIADFVSMNSDGFTFNVSSMTYYNVGFRWLALGGTDLSVKVGTFNASGATGAQAVTGVGFQGKALLTAMSRNSTTDGSAGHFMFGTGMAVSSSKQFAAGNHFPVDSFPQDPKRKSSTTACIIRGNDDGEAGFTSWDSDGFTVNWAVATGGMVGYVALGGTIDADLGQFTQPASTGAQALTGLGITPTFAMFMSGGQVTPGSSEDNGASAMGLAMAGSQDMVSLWNRDNVAPSQISMARRNDSCIGFIENDVETARAAFTSFASGTININWGLADATARAFSALALAAAGGGPASPLPVFMNHFRQQGFA